MTPAERIAELEAEVLYLRGQLGYMFGQEPRRVIRDSLKLTATHARIGQMLWVAKGRALSVEFLEDHLPPLKGERNHPRRAIAVQICLLRKILGRAAIINDYGKGYRISDEARARIDAVMALDGKPGKEQS